MRVDKVLVVGDLITDIEYRVSRVIPLPENPDALCLVNPEQTTIQPGGAANAAINLANTGSPVVLVGLASAQLISIIKAEGESIEVICPNHENMGTVWCEKRRYTYEGRIQSRIDQDPAKQEYEYYEDDLCDIVEEVLFDIHTVLLSDYDKGTIGRELVRIIADSTPQLWVVDPKYTLYPEYASPNVVLKPNAREAMYITGTNNALDALHSLHHRYGCPVVITCGSDGIWYAEHGKVRHKEVDRIDPVSVVGAGDTAAAVLAASLLRGLSLKEAVGRCAACCTHVISQRGTAPLSVEFWQGLK